MYGEVLRKKIVLPVLMLLTAGFLSSCGLLPEEEETLAPPLIQPKRQEYELYKVERKDITRYVKGVGFLEPVNQAQLYFRESDKNIKSIDVKYGQQVKKGTIVARIDCGNLEIRIKQQEIEVKKAELELGRLQKQLDLYGSMLPEHRPPRNELDKLEDDIKIKAMDLDSEKIALDGLRKDFEESVLKAPFNGQVTFIEDLEEGDPVEAYETVVTVADPAELQVYYQSDNVKYIKTGMKAEILIDETKLEGVVTLSPDNVPADAHEKFKNAVLISVPHLPSDAELGDSVELSIPVESRKNTVVIPKKGLQRMFGNAYVRVMDGDSKQEVDVETGIETYNEVEITSGLKEGQMVILN